jgi:ribose transport system permease protein
MAERPRTTTDDLPAAVGIPAAIPAAAAPASVGPDGAGPDVAGPDVARPDVARPDVAGPDVAAEPGQPGRWTRLRSQLGFRNISALYIFVAIFIVFAIRIPRTFLADTTWRTLLDNQVVTGLTAIALLIPLAAGVFNLAIGLQVGAGSVLAAWLLVSAGLSGPAAMVVVAASGVLIGLFSGFLIVRVRIDSFIATLGVSSLLAAAVTAISDGQQILGVPESFANLGTGRIGGITYSFILLLIVSGIVWYVLERTPAGRRTYATGGNIDAARLSGVRTTAVIYCSLAACGLIAALAGMLVTARLANADPTIGPGYLVPAFTAAFLGSTQFRGGRFNVWGTIVSVYVLAAGVKGLQLSGAPVWIPDAFNGISLLVAVGLAKFQGHSERFGAIRRLLRLSGAGTRAG